MPARRGSYDDEDDADTRAIAVEPTQVGGSLAIKTPPGIKLPEPLSDTDDPYVGTIVSERYRVLRKLGEGGMGIVYLAEHIVIEKKVALKVLSDDFARKADLVARFMQEAKAASRIGHENIVDITDFGQTAAGSVFIAMEFLEGCDLATAIREQGPMDFQRVTPIALQICRALAAAHGKGIIHRDMKPENIFLVTRDGRPDFVKVLDFGIAKMSTIDEPSERLTRTGMIFGTPEYMSPEQARGDRPDHRVDIYALGCIIYEMLTGDVPFHAETFMGVLTKHMFEQPETVSARAQVSPAVEAVVMKALAKNRDDRYQSMRELAQALVDCSSEQAGNWGVESSGVFASRALPPPTGTVPTVTPKSDTSVEVPLAVPRSKMPLVIGGLLIAAVAGVAITIASKKPPVAVTPTQVETPVVAPKPIPPVVPVTTPTQTKVTDHRVVIEVKPANLTGAVVMNGTQKLGKVPGTFMMSSSAMPTTLSVQREGYKSCDLVVRDIPGQKDLTLLAELEPIRKAPVGKHPGAAPVVKVEAPKVPETKPVPVVVPTPTPEPKPTPPKRKLDGDLMNPFDTAK